MDKLDKLTELTSRLLERELTQAQDGEPDLKRLRELSGLMKDVSQLRRELRDNEARSVEVRFLGQTEQAAE